MKGAKTMPGTLSAETARRYERHQQSVEELDRKLSPHGLRFLLSLPDHSSILTNKEKSKGIDRGIRHARAILHFIENGTITGDSVTDYINRTGRKLIT